MQFMGMRVVYNKRSRLPPSGALMLPSRLLRLFPAILTFVASVRLSEEHGATYVSFDELLEQSDVISVLCPLTPATRHLISYPVSSIPLDQLICSFI